MKISSTSNFDMEYLIFTAKYAIQKSYSQWEIGKWFGVVDLYPTSYAQFSAALQKLTLTRQRVDSYLLVTTVV